MECHSIKNGKNKATVCMAHWTESSNHVKIHITYHHGY